MNYSSRTNSTSNAACSSLRKSDALLMFSRALAILGVADSIDSDCMTNFFNVSYAKLSPSMWYSRSVMASLFSWSLVQALFFMRGPFAVVGRIAGLVVDAFQCQSARALAHVGHEVFIAIPSGTHRDSSTAIVRETLTARIRAAIPHGRPRNIATREVTLDGGTVCGLAGCRDFSPQTTTTLCPSTSQVIASDGGFCSAQAQAFPERILAISMGIRPDLQAAEDIAHEIHDVWRSHFVVKKSIGEESTILLTSSATEIPRRLACFLSKAICGSVKEIINLVIAASIPLGIQA